MVHGLLSERGKAGPPACWHKRKNQDNFEEWIFLLRNWRRLILALHFAETTRKNIQASDVGHEFVKCFERQSGHLVCSLHIDGGTKLFNVKQKLNRESTNIHCTTAYILQSNCLTEKFHGFILSHIRSILTQTILLILFWNHAILHEITCNNIQPHSTIGKASYDLIREIYSSTELQNIRPFGCRMQYHPITYRLSTFQPQLYKVICIGYDGGDVYNVLTADGIIRTKHVSAFESQFTDLTIIKHMSAPSQDSHTSPDTDENNWDNERYSL